MKEKIINICGKNVKLIYCAATENSFETVAGKSIGVFVPTLEERDGKTIITKENNDVIKFLSRATRLAVLKE